MDRVLADLGDGVFRLARFWSHELPCMERDART